MNIKFPHIDSIITEEVDLGALGLFNLTMEIWHYEPVRAGMHEHDQYWIADVKTISVLKIDGREVEMELVWANRLIKQMLKNGKIKAEVIERLED